jgi:hypothetical protein
MESSDWNTRKAAIDTAYTFGMVIPDIAKQYAPEFYQILDKCRSDKIKPVREVAVEASQVFKDLCPPEQLQTIKPKPTVSARPKTAAARAAEVKAANRPADVKTAPGTRIAKGAINPNFFKA